MDGEAQITDDLGAQHAGDIRGGGSAAARGDFLGDAAAADDVAALEDKGGESGTGQVGGRGQPIVPSADDNGVVGLVVMTCSHGLSLNGQLHYSIVWRNRIDIQGNFR